MNRNIYMKLINQRMFELLLILFVAVTTVTAQTNEIEALIKTAKAADQANNFKESIASFEKAIELDPHNSVAHLGLYSTKQRQIIRAAYPADGSFSPKAMEEMQTNLKNFDKEYLLKYEQLEQKYSDKAAYKLVLWRLNVYDPLKALTYLDAANKVEPDNLEVLQALAMFETSRGDNRKAVEFYQKILSQKPDDSDTLLYYILALKDVDKKLYKEKTFDFIKRFPEEQKAFQALQILIYDTESDSEKLGYYDQMRKLFPPEKLNGSANSLTGLFEIYHLNAPDKALALAEEMVKIAPSENTKKTWQGYLEYQSGIKQAGILIKEKKGAEALTVLEKAKPPRFFQNASPYYLIKAEAQIAAGQTETAYNDLSKYYVDKPRQVVRQKLDALGKKLGKDKKQVGKDIEVLIVAQTKPIKDFSLVRFDTGKKVSLADYRGKVVLLNFWYPLCGPCHQEAPYLQKLTEKYGKDGFVILAINVHPKEDSMVLPYFQKTKYNFIPLQVPDEEFAEREYQAKGFPTNYLVNKQGQMVANIGVVYQAVFEEVQQKIEIALAQ